MQIKAIIFDLDGTLLNSIIDIADACNHVLQANNLPTHKTESYISWIGNGAAKLVEHALPENIQNNPEKLIYFVEAYKTYYLQNLMVKSYLYEGIGSLLAYLKGKQIPFAINTNKPHEQTLPIVLHYMKDFMPSVVAGQMEGIPKKPNPTAALKIANSLNVQASEVLFIGDSEVDIKTGISANMQTLGVTWGYGKKSEMEAAGCINFVKNGNELLQFVLNILK